MERYPLLVAGAAATEDYHTILQPYDQEPFAEVEQADDSVIATALENVSRAYRERHTLSAEKRSAILKKLAEKIRENKEDLAKTIASEGGKPLKDALVEASRAATTVEIASEESVRICGQCIPMARTAAVEKHLSFTRREPIGPVLCISAFNHPLNLICHQAIPALAAGNPVVIKPASQTPVSCIKLIKLLFEAGLPEHWASVVPVLGERAGALITSPTFAFVNFIGSEKVGWGLRKSIAPGTRLSLELGGTGTAIVLDDADIDELLPGIVRASYYHAGQVCISTQNIYVHEDIYEEFLLRFKRAASELQCGDPLHHETDVGPIINQTEMKRIQSAVAAALEAGAECVLGNEHENINTLLPTILTETTNDMEVMAEEIFGPVVSIVSFHALNDVIESINSSRFCFQLSVYTQNIHRALQLSRQIQTKAFLVNECTAFRVDWMPFGGAKCSGLGTGGVASAMHEMSTEKLIIVKSTDD